MKISTAAGKFILAASILTAGMLTACGGEDAPTSARASTSSATPEPSETDPVELIGKPTTTSLRVLNTTTTAEQNELISSTPIDGNLSPEEAFQALADYDRGYANGGVIDQLDTTLPELPESAALGEATLANIYSDQIDPDFITAQLKTRALHAMFIEGYNFSLGYNNTIHEQWNADEFREIDEGTYEVDFTYTMFTNIDQADDMFDNDARDLLYDFDKNIAGRPGTMIISNDTGQWLRDSVDFTDN